MSKEFHKDPKPYKPPTSTEPEFKAPKQWSGQSLKCRSDGYMGPNRIELKIGLSPSAGDPSGGVSPGPVRLPNPGGKRK